MLRTYYENSAGNVLHGIQERMPEANGNGPGFRVRFRQGERMYNQHFLGIRRTLHSLQSSICQYKINT